MLNRVRNASKLAGLELEMLISGLSIREQEYTLGVMITGFADTALMNDTNMIIINR